MTSHCSFDIKFEKFNKNIHIEFPKGLNIIYGESGSGKSKIIYSILNLFFKASWKPFKGFVKVFLKPFKGFLKAL